MNLKFNNGSTIEVIEKSEEPIRSKHKEIQPYYFNFEKLRFCQKVLLWFILWKYKNKVM